MAAAAKSGPGRLPANTQGAAWLAAGAAATATQLMAAKGLGDHIGSFEIVFVRAIASFALVAGLAPRLSWSLLAPRRPWLLALRSVLATVTLTLLFYSVSHIPLGDAQALNFANVVFVIPLSALFLGETIGRHRWAAVVLGFIGVLIVLRPTGEVSLGALAGALSAVTYAAMLITVRALARTMSADAIYAWGILGLAAMSLPPAVATWSWPTGPEWLFLAAVGILGAAGQYFATRAFAIAEASAIAPVDYLKLVFALLGGALVFSETPDAWTLVGAAAIVGATAYATYREARRRAPPPSPSDSLS